MFLAGIVAPLADENDELTEEETEKLPLQLQYYDKPREKDLSIRQKLLQTLYQVIFLGNFWENCTNFSAKERLIRFYFPITFTPRSFFFKENNCADI